MATFSVLSSLKDLWDDFKVTLVKSDDEFKVYYLVATAVVVISLLVRKLLDLWRVNLPPGPPGLPFIGHMHLLGAYPHRSLAAMAQKHGPLMSIRLGARRCLVCTSPETAKEFLKTQDANFGSRPYTSQGEHLLYGRQDVAFQATNPSWRNLKKIFTTELVSGARLEESRHIREDEVACMLSAIHAERTVELNSQLSLLISNVVSRMVLNKRYYSADRVADPVEKDFPEMVQTHFRLAGLFVPGDYIPAVKWLDLGGFEAQMKKHKLHMDAFVSDIVSQRRAQRRTIQGSNEHSFVDVLLDQMEMKDAPFQLSEDNVKALILDAFIGATESMILTSEWAIAELLRNPSLMLQAHAELDAVIGRDRVVRESDLQKLPYLQAIVKETFRLHPAAPLLLPRESSHASRAFGYDLSAGTRVLVNVWAMGRDPALWQEPLVFKPERFLEPELAHVDMKGQQLELLAFGAGRRACPAVAMGVLVVQFVVASLLQSFEWSLPAHMAPEDVDMTELFGVSLPRAAPLPCVATPRLSPHLYAFPVPHPSNVKHTQTPVI